MTPRHFLLLMSSRMILSSSAFAQSNAQPVRLITLDPGHFHAALVQKFMYQPWTAEALEAAAAVSSLLLSRDAPASPGP